MIRISKEKVLLLHKLIAEETGGSIGVRDEGLLESAINNAYATFDGTELYKTKEEKASPKAKRIRCLAKCASAFSYPLSFFHRPFSVLFFSIAYFKQNCKYCEKISPERSSGLSVCR